MSPRTSYCGRHARIEGPAAVALTTISTLMMVNGGLPARDNRCGSESCKPTRPGTHYADNCLNMRVPFLTSRHDVHPQSEDDA